MAKYSLNRYLTVENAKWFTYQLDENIKNFLPIIVFDADIDYNTSDTYAITYSGLSIPVAFDLPICHQVIFGPAPGSQTYSYQNVYAYQLKNKYLTMQATTPDLNLGIQFVWKDLKGDIIISNQNNYPAPPYIFCNCYYLGLIRFSNGVVKVCSDLAATSQSETVKTDIEKGSGDLASDIKGTMQSEVLHFACSDDYFNRGSSELWNTILNDSTEWNPDNPYQGGDRPSEDVTGTFSYTSDDNPIPELPTTSVTDSGLVTLYAPTEAQLQALASYLWSDTFSLDSFKKLFNNPMDCILGLTMVPVNLPHGSAREITVGNIVSTVSCDVCSSQYVSVDCGTFKFSSSRFTGSFLDFSPYLKCYLYLPFIGTNEIDIDEWQNSTMRVVYHVDILTGAMFCFVTRNGKLVTTYSGQCAENIPLSSNDFSTTIGSILGVASTAVGAIATVATAGAAAPAAAAAKTAGTVAGAGLSTAVNVGHSKPSIRHGGGVGGGAGIMGKKYPYLVFVAPHMASPDDQNKYVGFPSNKIVQLSSCSGYTEVQAVNLSIKAENITDKEYCTPSATDAEMDLIKSLLESGVIF